MAGGEQSSIIGTSNNSQQQIPGSRRRPWKDESANFGALAAASLRKNDGTPPQVAI